jgi:hypothetical protein
MSAVTPTPKEMDILWQAAEIEWKLLWLREHPGKTRRDWRAAARSGEVSEWRRAKGEARIAAEEAAWLKDHGTPLPEHRCGWDDQQCAAYDAWKHPAKIEVA